MENQEETREGRTAGVAKKKKLSERESLLGWQTKQERKSEGRLIQRKEPESIGKGRP